MSAEVERTMGGVTIAAGRPRDWAGATGGLQRLGAALARTPEAVAAWAGDLAARRRRRRAWRHTVRILAGFDDRMLQDIGLDRDSIGRAAVGLADRVRPGA